MKRTVTAFLFAAAFAALFGSVPLRAQDSPETGETDPPATSLEVRGPISNLGETTFEVHTVLLTITESTVFEEIDGISGLADGLNVSVDYAVTAEGVNEAQVIARLSDDAGDEEQQDEEGEQENEEEAEEEESDITAIVDEVGAGYIVVTGLTIGVDEATRLEGFTELSELTGRIVEVEYVTHADGTMTALKVKLEEDDEDNEEAEESEIEAEGILTAVSELSISVDDVPFTLTAETVIRHRGELLSPLDLHVGDEVEVKGLDVEGTLVARRVKVEEFVGEEEIEVKGAVQFVSVAGRQLGVAGRTFTVAEDAEIEGSDETLLTLADLAIHSVVEVEGRKEADGSLTATKIEVARRLHHEGTFVGLFTGLLPEGLEVDGVLFLLADETILAADLVLADLVGGERLKVRFRQLADGSRLAMKVRLLEEEDETSFTGTVDSFDGTTLVVSGVAVTLTETTVIEGTDGEPTTADALAAGQTVEVKLAEGGLTAEKIEIKIAVVVSGAVESSGAGTLVVAGNEVVLTDETLILGSQSGELEAGALTSGLSIEVLAVYEASAGKVSGGQFVAERVYVQESTSTTALEPDDSLPAGFALDQNYPNPFNPTTTIRFGVLGSGQREVALTIYNAAGQEVRTLVRGSLVPGRYAYEWDGRTNGGEAVASGLYLYRLQVGSEVVSRSMVLLK